jgi:hypothetical protein
MSITKFLPFLSTLITFVFAAAVFQRYLQRRGIHLLLWSIGLVLYGAGTLTEAYLALGWSDLALRVWYLSGAMLTAAWLGQGTAHLLVRRRGVAGALTAILALVSLVAIVKVFGLPVNGETFNQHIPVSAQYKEMMTRDGLTRSLTVLLNIYGSIGLIGGAVWSAYLFARKRVLPHRVIGNILIAVGALMPATAGTLIKFGLGDWLYVSELLGAAIMFAGFIAATNPQPATTPQAAAA